MILCDMYHKFYVVYEITMLDSSHPWTILQTHEVYNRISSMSYLIVYIYIKEDQ